MKGVPWVAIQEYLGHSDIKMTLRYAHGQKFWKKMGTLEARAAPVYS